MITAKCFDYFRKVYTNCMQQLSYANCKDYVDLRSIRRIATAIFLRAQFSTWFGPNAANLM